MLVSWSSILDLGQVLSRALDQVPFWNSGLTKNGFQGQVKCRDWVQELVQDQDLVKGLDLAQEMVQVLLARW